MVQAREEQEAAIIIQKNVRGWIGRRRFVDAVVAREQKRAALRCRRL